MSIPERPVIDDMPPAPVRGQSFSLFNERANAHAAAQQTLVTQLNAGLNWAELTFTATEQSAQQAQQSAQQAQQSAQNAAGSAAHASTAMQGAESARNESQTFRNEAEFYATAAADTFDIPALAGQAGKVLTVDPEEEGFGWEEALPPVAAGDVGLALVAKEGGGGEWGASGVPSNLRYAEFNESGLFEKHSLAQFIYVEVIPAGPGGTAGSCEIRRSGSNTVGETTTPNSGNCCARLFRADEVPQQAIVTVGAGGVGGLGGELEQYFDGGSVTTTFSRARTTAESGGASWFIAENILSSQLERLPMRTAMTSEMLKYYPSPAGVSSRVSAATDNGVARVLTPAVPGFTDDAGKSRAQPGADATDILPAIGGTLVLAAGDAGNALDFCGGAPGGCAAIGNDRANAGVYIQNVTATAVAGDGSPGGRGSPGGPGGSAVIGTNFGNGTTLRVVAGDGGLGGDGLVRIWQW